MNQRTIIAVNYGLFIAAIVSIQSSAALSKSLLDLVHPITVQWLRLTFAALLLLGLAGPTLAREARGRTRKDWVLITAFALCMSCMGALMFAAFNYIPIGMAVAIEFLGPLGVGLFGVRRKRDIIWVILAGIAVAMFSGTSDGGTWVGVVLAGIAAGGWGGYITLGAKIKHDWTGSATVLYACTVGSVIFLPVALYHDAANLLSANVLFQGFGIGLLSTAFPMVMQMRVLKTIPPGVYGVLSALEPVMASLFAFLILGEQLTQTQMIAIGLVVIAAIGVTRANQATIVANAEENEALETQESI